MCSCLRATYVIRNGSLKNSVEILCLWTQLSEFIKVCNVMTALSRCLTACAVGRRQRLRSLCALSRASLCPLALPSAPWACGAPSVPGSADCSKASVSSVCACQTCLSLSWDLAPPLSILSVLVLNQQFQFVFVGAGKTWAVHVG